MRHDPITFRHRNTYARKLNDRTIWQIRQLAAQLADDVPSVRGRARVIIQQLGLGVCFATVEDIITERSFRDA